ncbi:hypothetical protein SDC9_103925 [bioreactor metagenome]|uniref:Uncharacterized protein n=1 Tax=bioreactor metagenome TaxID=1076179 RepID=A0A645AVE6_9ZZZZ
MQPVAVQPAVIADAGEAVRRTLPRSHRSAGGRAVGQPRRTYPDASVDDSRLDPVEQPQIRTAAAPRHQREFGRAVVVLNPQSLRTSLVPQVIVQPVAGDQHHEPRRQEPRTQGPPKSGRSQRAMRSPGRIRRPRRPGGVGEAGGEQVHGRAERSRDVEPAGGRQVEPRRGEAERIHPGGGAAHDRAGLAGGPRAVHGDRSPRRMRGPERRDRLDCGSHIDRRIGGRINTVQGIHRPRS